MQYNQLSTSYKYDTIVEAMYARELEHFHYAFDAENFKFLIANTIDGPYKQELQARLDSTLEQMRKVEGIYKALEAQIKDSAEYTAAVERAVLKRNMTK